MNVYPYCCLILLGMSKCQTLSNFLTFFFGNISCLTAGQVNLNSYDSK